MAIAGSNALDISDSRSREIVRMMAIAGSNALEISDSRSREIVRMMGTAQFIHTSNYEVCVSLYSTSVVLCTTSTRMGTTKYSGMRTGLVHLQFTK